MYEGFYSYSRSESIFRQGEAVYINKAYEKSESHLHAHDFIEIAYVASGCGVHRIGNKEYTVSKGDLFVINYDILHEFRSLPDPDKPPLYVYNCIFKPEFLDASLMSSRNFTDITYHFLFCSLFPEEIENRADIRISDNDNNEIEDLYEKMFREYQLRDDGYIEILRAYVIELLIMIFRIYRKQSNAENSVEARRRQIIQDVIQYMKSNFSHEFKLEDLSVMAFLSRNYFCRLFKEYTGMTVSEYTQKIRVEEACRLLKESDKKVIEIAGDVGYKDLKFFHQVFKRITGKSPGEYRKAKQVSK